MFDHILSALRYRAPTIFLAVILFFVCSIVVEDRMISMAIMFIVVSPILLSILADQKLPMKRYLSGLFSWRSVLCFCILALSFIFSIFLSSLFLHITHLDYAYRYGAIIVYGPVMLSVFPVLHKLARRTIGRLPTIRQYAAAILSLLIYVGLEALLKTIANINAVLLVTSAFLGTMVMAVAFCSIAAIYTYTNR